MKRLIRNKVFETNSSSCHSISITSDMELKDKGVKKILVLGEKDFGFNIGKVDLTRIEHKHWYW